MSATRLAGRYAKSLLDLAIETNSLDAVFSDVNDITKTIDGSKELKNLLKSPIVNASKKQSILKAVFGGKVSNLTEKFIQIVINKGRENVLPEIMQSFTQQYNKHFNTIEAKVTVASEITDAIKAQITSVVKQQTGSDKVSMTVNVDPSILGGFVLFFEDKIYDSSVKRKIENLKKQFVA